MGIVLNDVGKTDKHKNNWSLLFSVISILLFIYAGYICIDAALKGERVHFVISMQKDQPDRIGMEKTDGEGNDSSLGIFELLFLFIFFSFLSFMIFVNKNVEIFGYILVSLMLTFFLLIGIIFGLIFVFLGSAFFSVIAAGVIYGILNSLGNIFGLNFSQLFGGIFLSLIAQSLYVGGNWIYKFLKIIVVSNMFTQTPDGKKWKNKVAIFVSISLFLSLGTLIVFYIGIGFSFGGAANITSSISSMLGFVIVLILGWLLGIFFEKFKKKKLIELRTDNVVE